MASVTSSSGCMCSELGPQPKKRKAFDDATLEQVVHFHGHLCPGLAMGMQVASIVLREIGPHSVDEEVVAVVETDMCGVDGIQFLTGCTFGKGNLIHRDYGKNAYTFFRRSDGKAIRIAARPDAWKRNPEHQALFAKIRAGEATDAERTRFRELHESLSHDVLALDPLDLYSVTEIDAEPPDKARIHESIPCARCGEGVMATRIRRAGDEQLCQPCFEAAAVLA